MNPYIELGLDTFGDVTLDADGRPLSQAQVIRNVIDEAVLADELGVDFIGVGEHHRADFAVSAPEVVLAAIAGRTSRIRLGSAVTVLSSDDPVRVFQRFATLDAASNGRAEVILGRGSFTESFPLFGYPLDQYETLFEEKLELFAALLEHDRTGDAGDVARHDARAARRAARLPADRAGALTTWIGVGGSPESVVRAARYGMPLMLAIIGGDPRRFAPYVDLYHRALEQLGAEPLPIGVHSPGYIADTDAQAREELWPALARDAKSHRRRARLAADEPSGVRPGDRGGSLYVGAPETVAQEDRGDGAARSASTRFDMKYSAGTLAHDKLMRSIELYGREVIPRVRELVAAAEPEVRRAGSVTSNG